MTFTAKL